jgi:hypothetical protein
MPESPSVSPAHPTPQPLKSSAPKPACDTDKMLCERCRAEMFRMHAVWRCPACGYKTDCCGW